ncbi:hypothetical protein [Desulfosoma sp.]
MKELWNVAVTFLKEYNMTKAGEVLRTVDWTKLLHEPLLWGAVILFLGWVVWKKACEASSSSAP